MILLDIIVVILALYVNKKLMESLQVKEANFQHPEEQKILIQVEEINSILYAWKDGKEFIGQANTKEELKEIIKKKYQGIELVRTK